jgi:hypothetical protein
MLNRLNDRLANGVGEVLIGRAVEPWYTYLYLFNLAARGQQVDRKPFGDQL